MKTAGIVASQQAAKEAVSGDVRAALVMALGRAYHQSGAATDQLEAVMHAAADVLDLELQVTALPTSITAACGPPDTQRVVLMRLEPGIIDLRRLALLNIVFDRVLARTIAPEAALEEVEAIAAYRQMISPLLSIGAFCVLSVGVSLVLGGRTNEAICSGLVGMAVGATAAVARRSATVERLFVVIAGFLATFIVTLYATRVAPIAVYVPIVAGVVQVLPGYELTTALHELAYRNLVAGTSRLGSVFMTLLSLGCGFALGIAILGPGALHIARIVYVPIPWYALAGAVIAIGTGIGVLEDARPIDLPWVFGSCAVAEVTYRVFELSPAFQVATFGAALVVGLLANVGTRFARIPQEVLLIPGVLIIVPGALSYESILLVLQSDAADASTIALNAVIASVEIVSGLLLAQLFIAPRRS
jgi:uncharacterized membrane protein YjjP (DUF1212 family)